jgi:large subunit ribosomal protein L1
VPRIISEAKKGRLEFRMDKTALLHLPIGKASFPPQHLLENLAVAMDSVMKSRPEGVKGQLIRSLTLCSTMGPPIKLDLAGTLSLRPE